MKYNKYISTNHLEAIVADSYVKVIVRQPKREFGGAELLGNLLYSPYGVTYDDFGYDYVRRAVDRAYKDFGDEEIKELINKVKTIIK